MKSEKDDRKPSATGTKCRNLKNEASYRRLLVLTRIMDKWGIDPLLGFFVPALGDLLTSVMTLPYLYFAIIRLKSLPLTLAMVYNMLLDMLAGMIPYGIGDVFDVFHRSYVRNSRLLTGFVEGDRMVIDKVNTKARLTAFLIVLLAVLLVLVSCWVTTLFARGMQLILG